MRNSPEQIKPSTEGKGLTHLHPDNFDVNGSQITFQKQHQRYGQSREISIMNKQFRIKKISSPRKKHLRRRRLQYPEGKMGYLPEHTFFVFTFECFLGILDLLIVTAFITALWQPTYLHFLTRLWTFSEATTANSFFKLYVESFIVAR